MKIGDKVKIIKMKPEEDDLYTGALGVIHRIDKEMEYPYLVLLQDGCVLCFLEEELKVIGEGTEEEIIKEGDIVEFEGKNYLVALENKYYKLINLDTFQIEMMFVNSDFLNEHCKLIRVKGNYNIGR